MGYMLAGVRFACGSADGLPPRDNVGDRGDARDG